jgi:hypothetical protein
LAPLQIYAHLLDEGVYLCSVSTMYRVLTENKQVKERRRLARHPAAVCPELVATAARQVYSWDITKLADPVKGTYFDAYVMIDIYSRFIVGVPVTRQATAANRQVPDLDRNCRVQQLSAATAPGFGRGGWRRRTGPRGAVEVVVLSFGRRPGDHADRPTRTFEA